LRSTIGRGKKQVVDAETPPLTDRSLSPYVERVDGIISSDRPRLLPDRSGLLYAIDLGGTFLIPAMFLFSAPCSRSWRCLISDNYFCRPARVIDVDQLLIVIILIELVHRVNPDVISLPGIVVGSVLSLPGEDASPVRCLLKLGVLSRLGRLRA
jgi:hypothetical protein